MPPVVIENDAGLFEPEYAEVFGVPFSFIPTSGDSATPKPGPPYTRVRALEDRIGCEITFPRLTGYLTRFSAPTTARAARDGWTLQAVQSWNTRSSRRLGCERQ